MDIGEKIKYLRSKEGLTLEQVGDFVGVGKSTVRKWESGDIKNMRRDKIASLAAALHTTPAYLMGWDEKPALPPDAIPYVRGRRLPILGTIPAGVPVLADEDIEGYDYADVPEGEDYFFLRVRGYSMINAGISPGDLVLIKVQSCADNGQIVACRVNGDESTLKRFKQQGDTVILMPENSAYEPIIVSCADFESGYASIIGVAVEVKRRLL